jgi:hypothetical protein
MFHSVLFHFVVSNSDLVVGLNNQQRSSVSTTGKRTGSTAKTSPLNESTVSKPERRETGVLFVLLILVTQLFRWPV